MSFVYKKTEATLWTVGHYYEGAGGAQKWEPESDHGSEQEAADRVRYLNGGQLPPPQDVVLQVAGVRVAERGQITDPPEGGPRVTPEMLQAIPERYRFVLAAWLRQRCLTGAAAHHGAFVLGEQYVAGNNAAHSGAAADLVEPVSDDTTWVAMGRRLAYLERWWADNHQGAGVWAPDDCVEEERAALSRETFDKILGPLQPGDVGKIPGLGSALAGQPVPYVCGSCGRTNRNADDIANRYCGGCHLFADQVGTALDPTWINVDGDQERSGVDANPVQPEGPDD